MTKSRMKVLQVLPTLSAGGAEGFVTNLGVALKALEVDVQFYLLAGARGARGKILLHRLEQAGIKVVGAEERNIRSVKNVTRLVSLIRSWDPDILQANLYSSEVVGALAGRAAFQPKRSMVRRLTNTAYFGKRSPFLRRLMDRAYPTTIACSSAVETAYATAMEGRQNSEVVVINNGGLLKEKLTSDSQRKEARESFGLSDSAFVVVNIGKFLGDSGPEGLSKCQKAQDVLLRAFAKAFANDPSCILLLVGDGPLRDRAQQLSVDLGIADRTKFVGQQPEPWPALSSADVFCFPSRFEGSPNVIPEAASCGLPVIASDIPEISSLCPSKDSWALCRVDDVEQFANAMIQARDNRKTMRATAESVAPQIREKHSMRQCAREYYDAYCVALARNEESAAQRNV